MPLILYKTKQIKKQTKKGTCIFCTLVKISSTCAKNAQVQKVNNHRYSFRLKPKSITLFHFLITQRNSIAFYLF